MLACRVIFLSMNIGQTLPRTVFFVVSFYDDDMWPFLLRFIVLFYDDEI
jgi:hypothetical protein